MAKLPVHTVTHSGIIQAPPVRVLAAFFDGKDLGGKGTLGAIITLCHHRTGAPLAMATYSGAKNDCELPVGQTLLEQAAEVLPNAVVTTDALHSQKKRR